MNGWMDAEVCEKLEWRDWKESESYVEDRIDSTQGPAGYDGQREFPSRED